MTEDPGGGSTSGRADEGADVVLLQSARVEAMARGMALALGLDPEAPYPAEIRESLQTSGGFHPQTWTAPDTEPAWRVLAREMVLTGALAEDDDAW